MRKGLMMTPRDMLLLEHLSLGPATGKSILINIFDAEGSNRKTRERVMLRRLAKHMTEGLIKSTVCPTFKDQIYFLARKAAPIVAARYGWEISHIWVNFNANTVEHDLIAAGCGRKIIMEAGKKKLFELSFIVPECGLKSGNRLKKGVYYPDLLFGIKGAAGTKTFSLEVDCGSISRRDFLGKINYFEGTPVVVTKTWKRLHLLLWYLQSEKIARPVYLTTVGNFIKSGFISCEWQSNSAGGEMRIEL